MIFSAITALYVGNTSYSKAYVGDVPVWPVSVPVNYLTFEILSGGTIQLSGNCTSAQTVEYRVNNGSWNTMTVCGATSSDAITVNAGDIVEWRGNNDTYGGVDSGRVSSSFKGTSYFNTKGRILSLFYGDDAAGYDAFLSTFSCCELFKASNVVSAAELVLPNTVRNYCYFYMFSGCTSLVNAPALPATTLAHDCYNSMFYGCTSLVNAPALPATTLASDCYNSMFQGCTSLVNAPALPATTLANWCYDNMFAYCTSLVNAPALPATTLANGCYYIMFLACTSLVNAPALPATTLVYSCYTSMFEGCTSLSYVKCLAESGITGPNVSSWLNGVASTGTFVKKAGVTWPSGTTGIPDNWTIIEE